MSTPGTHAVAASYVFDGVAVLRDTAVIIEGHHIVDVKPRDQVDHSISIVHLPADAWLAPGFIDVQVNGGGDVLFNDDVSATGVNAIAAAHRRFGTTGLLPTLISDTRDKMQLALNAARAAAASNPSILGIHFEGPFLSPEKPGVHDKAMFRVPEEQDLSLLTSWKEGTVLVTLAPERVPEEFITRLSECGVRVALGHSAATYEQARSAMEAGLTGFTHLFNAMPQLLSRAPGPVAAALECPNVWFGMIPDGVHVAPPMLRLALRCEARPMLVTDAMPPVGGARARFTLYGEEITTRDGMCVRDDGTLAGAAVDMASCVRNTVRDLGATLPQALQYASTEPAEFLGLGTVLGRLAPAFRADMVAFEPGSIEVLETWVAGVPADVKQRH